MTASQVLAGLIEQRDAMIEALAKIEAGQLPTDLHPSSSPLRIRESLRSEIQVLETRIAWVRTNTEQKEEPSND